MAYGKIIVGFIEHSNCKIDWEQVLSSKELWKVVWPQVWKKQLSNGICNLKADTVK
jgi:hypothetical protein